MQALVKGGAVAKLVKTAHPVERTGHETYHVGDSVSSSSLASVTEIVPQLAYDLIGRIIPGIVIIFTWVLVFVGPRQAACCLNQLTLCTTSLFNAWSFIALIIAAYVLAFVLEGLCQLLVWDGFNRLRRDVSLQQRESGEREGADETFRFDMINQRWPHAGSWLTKLYAESTLCRTLTFGWGVAAAINLYFLIDCMSAECAIERSLLEAALVVGVLGARRVDRSIANTREKTMENLWNRLPEDLK